MTKLLDDLKNTAGIFVGKAQARSSVLNSLLWYYIPFSVFSLIAAVIIPSLSFYFGCGMLIYPVFFGFMYVYFAFTDPIRLQSETHQYRVFEKQMQSQVGFVVDNNILSPNPLLSSTNIIAPLEEENV